MADLVMIAVTMVFFAACIGFVALCDRIIGPDPVLDAALDDGGGTRSGRAGTSSTDDEPAVAA